MTIPESIRSVAENRDSGLLTVEQAAQRMGTPPRFVRRLIAERRIRFCHIGRYVRLASEDVDEFIDAGWVEVETQSHRSRGR